MPAGASPLRPPKPAPGWRGCAPSSTIRTSSLRLSACARSTMLSRPRCGTGHESVCTKARHESRTPLAMSPPNIADLGEGVWVGDWTPPPDSQGLQRSPLIPLGHDAFIARQLRRKRDDQDRLLARATPPSTTSRQRGSCCASAPPRTPTTFCILLQILPPHLTADFAAEHDAAAPGALPPFWSKATPPLPPTSFSTAQLAQRFGGLGLRSAPRVSAPPCKATEPCLRRPRLPMPHLCDIGLEGACLGCHRAP